MIDRVSRMSGGRIKSTYYRTVEAHHLIEDAAENEEGRLGADQRVETAGIWATEACTPDSVGRLLTALDRLARGYRGLGERDPATWIRRRRRRPGSSLYIHFSRPGGGGLPTQYELDLPTFADRAVATIWSATPSLTMMTVAFGMNETARLRLDGILRADHATRLRRIGRTGLGISTPDLERRRLVAEARAEWISEASRWFDTHLPGLFSARNGRVPTCELSVLTNIQPFPTFEDQETSHRDHATLHALKCSHADVFIPSGEMETEVFHAPFPDRHDGEDSHSVVAMTKAGYQANTAAGWGDDHASHFWVFDRRFRPLVAQWHLERVLRLFHDRVASVRDEFSEVIGGSKATSALGKVRRDTADCADAATIAREIKRGLEDRSLRLRGSEYRLRPMSTGDEERSATAALGETLDGSARLLSSDVTELNAALHAQANLLSAHANLRLQPWIIVLAIVSAVTGGIAAIEPIEKLLRSPIEIRPTR